MNWQRLSQTLALIAAGIGAVCFAGWAFGIDALTRLHPGWVTMKANTALSLLLAGAAVAVLRDEDCTGLKQRFAQCCGVVIALVGALTLCEIFGGWDFGIDQALFRETLAGAGRSFPGRMGPVSAMIFMLLGSAILLLDVRTGRGMWPAQFCAAAVAALTFLVFLGYFYNVEMPPAFEPYISIALHTVIAFLLLCAALLFARPARGFVAIFLVENTGGVIARRMLPTALLVPALLGWLFALGREHGYYGRGVSVALLAASITVIFTGMVWWIARALARADAQRRDAQGALLESERRKSSILDGALDAIITMDHTGKVVDFNPAAEGTFGFRRAEIVGQPMAERIIPERLRARHYEGLANYLATGQGPVLGRRIEVPARHADGHEFFVELSINRISGIEPAMFTATLRDITQPRAAAAALAQAKEEAEAASRAKDEFLAALSHELRTPLTPVLMLAAEMEQSADLPEAVRRDFALIRKNVELEARIIDDLLDITRITRGKLALRFETVEVHGLIEHALVILRSDRKDKRIAIALDLAAAEHHVGGDAVRLQQVFWNVLKNAIKFTPEGGRIAIRSWNENGHLRVATTDTGLGITAEDMSRIFTAFTQGREAAAPRFGGLGLGLSISALLVREHRGRIWAESAGRNEGSTFHLELPLAAAPAPVPSESALPAPSQSARSLHILLVEDHEDTRGILQRLITRWGHRVTIATTVAQARDEIAGGSFDLLLSDIGLPDGSGCDVIVALREKSQAPGVAMSGFGMEADLARSYAAGFSKHLVKPISADRLRELLTHFASSESSSSS